jgi:hypothetical protein
MVNLPVEESNVWFVRSGEYIYFDSKRLKDIVVYFTIKDIVAG